MKFFEKMLTLIVVATTIFASCAKKDVPSFDEQNKLPYYPRVGTFRSLTMPTVSNGMLVFSDQDHINKYIDYLDAIIMDEPQSEEEEDTDTTDIDDKLQAVETSLSFTSLRSELAAEFELLNEVGFETLEDIPKEHFIASSSIRSVLNPNYEVKIGNSIWVYYNEDYMLEITDGDIEKRDAIRGFRLNSPGEIHASIYFIPNVVPYGNGKVVCQLPQVTNTSGGGAASYDTIFVESGEFEFRNCEPYIVDFDYFLQVKVEDEYGISIVSPRSAMVGTTVVFDFGDGQTETSYDIGVVDHTYTTAGTYTVTATVTHNGSIGYGTFSSVYTFDVEVTGADCTNKNFNVMSGRQEVTSNLAYEWVTQGIHPAGVGFLGLGTGNDKVVSYIKSFRRINGNWKYRKVDRLATVLTGQLEQDATCTPLNVIRSAWPYNARCAEVVFTWEGFRVWNNDLHTDQRIWHNSDSKQDVQDLPIVCE